MQISITTVMALWKDLQSSGLKIFVNKQTESRLSQKSIFDSYFQGRFRDNPDPQQCRATFRHAIIDKLFILSTSANCALDADKILLDISNVTIQQKKIPKDFFSIVYDMYTQYSLLLLHYVMYYGYIYSIT